MRKLKYRRYEEWQKYKTEKTKGHVLVPDTIRFNYEVNGYDVERLASTSLKTSRKSVRLKKDNKILL